ncbi:MAG: CBS domain-containing protein, partial [Nitratireductor sp.]|nr:CBS domain-containing protein [Nitratireductor sp.]
LGTLMSEAIVRISEKGFGCVGVTDPSGNLVGVVTDGDLRRNINRDLRTLPIDEVMNRKPKTVAPSLLASSAMAILNESSITTLMVTDNAKPVGIIHLHDLLRIGVA